MLNRSEAIRFGERRHTLRLLMLLIFPMPLIMAASPPPAGLLRGSVLFYIRPCEQSAFPGILFPVLSESRTPYGKNSVFPYKAKHIATAFIA